MKIDPKAQAVTNLFMILAIIVMLALAWSVSRDNEKAEAEPSPPRTEAPASD